MSWSPRKKLAVVLLVFLGVLSFGAWQVLTRAVLVKEASSFIVPVLWFAGVFFILLQGALLWKERWFSAVATGCLLLPSLIQTTTPVHLTLVIIGMGSAYVGLRRIQRELTERIHLSLRRSLSVGLSFLIFAVSVVCTSQYYEQVRLMTWDRLVPSFDFSKGLGSLVIRAATPFSPELRNLQNTSVTVDEFLGGIQKPQPEDTASLAAIDPTKDTLWQQELARTKSELGRLLHREVSGSENMQSLMAEVIRKKMISLFSVQDQASVVPVLPLILSILVFLTIYPLLAFTVPFLSLIAHAFFGLYRQFGWVKVTALSVEQEVIES